MRVLVVEDEVRLAENIAIALREGPGYAVDMAHDGEDALHLCATASYDLIVLDLMLPRLHGIEVVQRLRAARNVTPVLMLTAVSGSRKTIELLDLFGHSERTSSARRGRALSGAPPHSRGREYGRESSLRCKWTRASGSCCLM